MTEEQKQKAEQAIRDLLTAFNEDTNREGLQNTPKRVVKYYEEFLNPPEFEFTTFESEGFDQVILQKDIPFFSLCEHHMLVFFGMAHVAYIPNNRIVGLSKLARTVEMYSRRLQNQERITMQVAERLEKELDPKGVAVVLNARHMCMEMRGVKTHDTYTTTSKLTGVFLKEDSARSEIMSLIGD